MHLLYNIEQDFCFLKLQLLGDLENALFLLLWFWYMILDKCVHKIWSSFVFSNYFSLQPYLIRKDSSEFCEPLPCFRTDGRYFFCQQLFFQYLFVQVLEKIWILQSALCDKTQLLTFSECSPNHF